MMLNAIIVEDELASRETLQSYLIKYCEGIEICGIADSVASGIKLVETKKPDLVFLDIEMPFGNGFDLLDQVTYRDFEVIFITAFSDYALKAIQVSAANYLLKPVSIDELVAAVESVRNRLQQEKDFVHTRILVENINLENRQHHKIILPTMEGFEVVRIGDILHCTADDNFTKFKLENGHQLMICRSLKHYEELLSDFDFIRVHKSYLINRHYVKRYRKGKGGTAVMTNGDEIDISISGKKRFLEAFGGMK